jgi:formylglycine-generating enzyme required for sulfatase activity
MACVSAGTTSVGSESPRGDGKWGHSDLAGNVFEWVLDWYSPTYPSSCDDCANLTEPPAGDAGSGAYRVIRGGSFDGSPACLLNSLRETSTPVGRSTGIGLRCARPPQP